MRPYIRASLLALTLSTSAIPAAWAKPRAAHDHAAPAAAPVAAAAQPAPLADLVKAVNIPYERFTLANGLTVLVHTDRKAPIVGVTTYYRVGSKNEPRGRTGFAHLYEHLFFGGSENVPSFDVPLEGAGSTPTNGSTWYDRTNYVETVPTGALDLALFMESDRMGHLLGAVTQDKLDKQRGVVQNEKRQGDNEPYGLVQYALGDGLLPVGHPYRHATIGSMADLNAASLGDVRTWFASNYAPNNVVLSLAGDIDAKTARPLVEKWFGGIPRGPAVAPVPAAPVTLAAAVSREMADQVPTTRLYRAWTGPGLNDADMPALTVGMRVLGGLSSSRLDNALVRGSQLAVAVTASNEQHEQLGFLQATMDIKPGTPRATAEAAFDAEIARLVDQGPSEDEVRRAATGLVAAELAKLEQVGGFYGKGATLAEGLLYSGNPDQFRADLARYAALTPADVRAALQRWLNRPVYKLAVVPGERTEKGETMGGWGDEASTPAPTPDAKAPAAALVTGPKRAFPPVAPVGDLAFPQVERTTLTNGMTVALARRTAVPKVMVQLSFDAGYAADSLDTPGTQSLMLAMLDEGTATRNSTQIAEEKERLGAEIGAGAGADSSAITLDALTPNLAPSLALMADLVRNPAFAADEVARIKDQRLTEIAQTNATPQALAMRTLTPLLFGKAHPYGLPSDGLGDTASVKALTPAALRSAHGKWLRPDLARITVVGDITMAQLKPLLEQAFGSWQAPAAPKPVKAINAAVPAPSPRIVLIDRPNSPQSVIVAGRVLPITGRTADQEAVDLANEVMGGGFLSRLNLDLREDKSWSYGVYSIVRSPAGPRTMVIAAPVQSDKTGDSVRQIIADMKAFPANRGIDAEELNRVTEGNIRGLPNRFETNAQVLGAVSQNDWLHRPDNYYATLPTRYRHIDATAINAAAKTFLQPDQLTYVVVGDRKLVEPQLKSLGLPIEIAPAVDSAAPSD
jgi:predicted Zn-dependent peptidase